jgi:hypothetical protein
MATTNIRGLYLDGSPFAAGVDRNPRTTLSLQKATELVVDVDVTNPSGAPTDLTNVVPVVFSLRKNPEPLNSMALVSRVCIIPAGAARGRTRFTVVPYDTVNLQPGRYVWDLRGKFPGNKWETLIGLSPLHLEGTAGFPDAPLTAPGGVVFYYAYPPLIGLLSLTGGLIKELGDALAPAVFSITYNRAANAATISDGGPPVALITPFTSVSLPGPYNGLTIGSQQAFTVVASEAGGPDLTSSVLVLWQPRGFWGAALPPVFYDEAFIEGLSDSALIASRAYSPGYSAGPGEKLYWCQPTAFGGTSSDFIDVASDINVGISKVATAVSVTNTFGVTLPYDIWESDVAGLGAVTIRIIG